VRISPEALYSVMGQIETFHFLNLHKRTQIKKARKLETLTNRFAAVYVNRTVCHIIRGPNYWGCSIWGMLDGDYRNDALARECRPRVAA